ncbi:hypothetical protein STCU_10860 [Strigomonas culicis]|uniref:Uncharacterized protein n=1 Tax=Strigomonas culicis TaxID=28005 RepID=S9UQY2_9TRYP|nr:hypothetical protein STCU_10860 [Strigomonas culicis]|eukprot:EPY17021.1 hypothetical protein STCU_10860 [Strigomonas culicis]
MHVFFHFLFFSFLNKIRILLLEVVEVSCCFLASLSYHRLRINVKRVDSNGSFCSFSFHQHRLLRSSPPPPPPPPLARATLLRT